MDAPGGIIVFEKAMEGFFNSSVKEDCE